MIPLPSSGDAADSTLNGFEGLVYKRPQVEVLLENDANPFARIEVGRANLFPPR